MACGRQIASHTYANDLERAKGFSTTLCVRLRTVGDAGLYDISIIKYGQRGFPWGVRKKGGRQIASPTTDVCYIMQTKRISTTFYVRLRDVEGAVPYNISIIKYGQRGFTWGCAENGGRQIASPTYANDLERTKGDSTRLRVCCFLYTPTREVSLRKARKRDVIPFSMAFDSRHPIVPSRMAMEESRCQ